MQVHQAFYIQSWLQWLVTGPSGWQILDIKYCFKNRGKKSVCKILLVSITWNSWWKMGSLPSRLLEWMTCVFFPMSTSLHLVVLLTPLHNTEYCSKEKLTGPVSKKHNGCCLPPHLTGYEKQLDLESHSTSKPHRNTRLLVPWRTFPPLKTKTLRHEFQQSHIWQSVLSFFYS